MQRQIFMILISFIFAIIICGASAAATNGTANETQNSTVCAADPVINGTVTINEFGHIRNLPNATVTVNSTSGRTLATTTTDANGYYSVSFYNTDTQFKITTSYLGCNDITNTVNVILNATDNIYYGTSDFQLSPIQAIFTSTLSGNGTNVWIQGDNMNGFAGALNVRAPASGGSNYYAFCIDIYTMIYNGDYLLVNGPLPGTTGNFSSFLLNSIDWGKVNYIISHYTPSNSTEGAAMQCAIWYLTSAPYGVYNTTIGGGGKDPNHPNYYQFLTYNSTINPNLYDGYSSTYGAYIVQRAFQMINSATSILYPASVTVDPGMTRALNGESVTVTATVKDQNGNPLPGITVYFTSTSGSLSIISGVSNALGQVTTILSGVAGNCTANVIASVTGNYGNLLYDDQYNINNKTQNLVAINLLPNVVSATSIINFDIQSNVTLTQIVNGGNTATVNVGDPLTFVITATCTGPNNATGLMIRDSLPPGFVPSSVTPSVGTYSNGVWTIPLLANGTSAILTITGYASSTMAGMITNNTVVRFYQNENDPQPDTATTTVYTKKADVVLTQTTTNNPANQGDTVTFTVTAKNNGPDTATNININDIIPTGLRNFSVIASSGTYNNGIWNIPSLNNGSNATLTITGIMDSVFVTNNVTRRNQTEYNSQSTTSSATIYNKKADIIITQTVNGSTSGNVSVNVGNNVTFIVTIKNNGPDTATNINIKDIIPAGFTAGTPSRGTFNSTTGIWYLSSLLSGASATLTITGTAGSSMAGFNTTNAVEWLNQTEYNSQPATNNASFYTKKAAVELTITTDKPGIAVGETVNFYYTVTNNGPDTATNIVISVNEPSLNNKNRSFSSTGTTYTGSSNPRTWTIPSLASGSSITFTLRGTGRSQNGEE